MHLNESEDKMSPPAKCYPPSKRPGDLERHFQAIFDKKRNKTAHACVRVVFSMKPKMNSEKLPKMVLIVVIPPPNAVNALIFLFSLVLAIQVERLITLLFYFNFNQQSASSNRLIHHPPNFIPSKVSCFSQPSSPSYQEWAWHFI